MKPCFLFLITEDWYFWSHRLPLARAVRDAGFRVIIATRVHNHSEQIKSEGFELIDLKLERRNKNILKELFSILEIIRIYRRIKPALVHHVTLKPVLYGSLAARICRVPCVVNALAGLGFIFSGNGPKSFLLKRFLLLFYRYAFAGKNTIGIFQNPEDLEIFQDAGIIYNDNSFLIKGAGVDTSQFIYLPEPDGQEIKILLASRLLWSKGVGEFVGAIGQLRGNGVRCKAILAGIPDRQNPHAIHESILEKWHKQGTVEWLGYRKDMAHVLSQSHMVVLPTTYGEGVPKILIEAASCGRPIVATDVPGCREIVRNKVNGLLVPTNSISVLVSAINTLIMNPDLRREMGINGRRIVETEFSEDIVIKQTMGVYNTLLHKAKLDQDKKLSI